MPAYNNQGNATGNRWRTASILVNFRPYSKPCEPTLIEEYYSRLHALAPPLAAPNHWDRLTLDMCKQWEMSRSLLKKARQASLVDQAKGLS